MWSHGHTFDNFHENLKSYIRSNDNELKEAFAKDATFKITVEAFNKHFTQLEKVRKIESLDYLPVESNADLNNPKIEWWYIEFWGLSPLHVPDYPEDILFGRWVNTFHLNLHAKLNTLLNTFS